MTAAASTSTSPGTAVPTSEDRSPKRLFPLVIALVAAAPTLVSAAHAGFVADDWGFLNGAERHGNLWWLEGVDRWFRPFQAAIHGVMFETFRGNATAALVLMAGLEIVVVLLLRRLAMRFVPERTANLIALAWAALPNRSAGRMWISATPLTVSVILLLAAGLAATSSRRRPVVATALCCAAVLTYEAGLAIGLLVVLWAWYDPDLDLPTQRVRLARPVLVYGAVVAWNVATSPKSPTSVAVTRSAYEALVGRGLMPAALGGWGAVLGLTVLAAAIAGSRRWAPTRTVFHVGALLALAALLPLLLVGASPAVSGPVDRLNTVPLLGVAVLLGVGLDGLARSLPRWSAGVGLVALAVAFAVAQSDDIVAVNAARRDAERAVEAFASIPPDLAGRHLVLDPGDGHRGWYAFGWDSAKAAIELRTGRELEVRDPPAGYVDLQPGELLVRIVGERVVEITPG